MIRRRNENRLFTMVTFKKKHSLMIRWNHWINFPVLTVMIWSGLEIYWANDVYFLPGSWLGALGFDHKLGRGMSWHFPFAFIFAVNGFLYAGYLFWTGQWRYIFPERRSIREASLVLLHDLGMHQGPLPKPVKYNGAQRFAYTSILFLGFGSLLTGLALYKPVQLRFLAAALGGYEAARLEHFILTLTFVAFFVVHVVQVIRAGWNGFRAMITGLERQDLERRDVE